MAAITRRSGNGPFAPLSATYYHDEAIADAGVDAELLYVRSLAYCASVPHTDGWMSALQVRRYVGSGLRFLDKRIAALVREKLWVEVRGGYQIKAWLRWNNSAEEIGRKRQTDRDRKAAVRVESERNPDGVREDSALHSTAKQGSAKQSTSVEESVGEADVSSGSGPEPAAPCAKHPEGPYHDAACGGCKRWRQDLERIDHADELAGKRAKAEALARLQACPVCHGSNWVPDTDPALHCTAHLSVTA